MYAAKVLKEKPQCCSVSRWEEQLFAHVYPFPFLYLQVEMGYSAGAQERVKGRAVPSFLLASW